MVIAASAGMARVLAFLASALLLPSAFGQGAVAAAEGPLELSDRATSDLLGELKSAQSAYARLVAQPLPPNLSEAERYWPSARTNWSSWASVAVNTQVQWSHGK